MSIHDFRSAAFAAARSSLWLVGILTLLAFPLQQAHSSHFRAHEVRSIVSHTLTGTNGRDHDRKASYKGPRNFARLVDDRDDLEPSIRSSAAPAITVKLFLTRRGSGPPTPAAKTRYSIRIKMFHLASRA